MNSNINIAYEQPLKCNINSLTATHKVSSTHETPVMIDCQFLIAKSTTGTIDLTHTVSQ
jgi:hypothetical protein